VGILNLIRAIVGIPHHRFNLFVKCSSPPGRTGVPLPWRLHRCRPRVPTTRASIDNSNFEAHSRSFSTRSPTVRASCGCLCWEGVEPAKPHRDVSDRMVTPLSCILTLHRFRILHITRHSLEAVHDYLYGCFFDLKIEPARDNGRDNHSLPYGQRATVGSIVTAAHRLLRTLRTAQKKPADIRPSTPQAARASFARD
jgi:hypothetical protein